MFARQVFRPAQTLQSVRSPILLRRHGKRVGAHPAVLTKSQHVRRRYASSQAPKTGGNNGLLYTGVALAAVSGGYFYMRRGTSPTGQAGNAPPSREAEKVPEQTAAPGKPAFTGGEQGFLSLKLEKSEIVNHNTKKLTFALPEGDMESGLHVACTSESCFLKATRC
jgi:cytochrome-b5 reductase